MICCTYTRINPTLIPLIELKNKGLRENTIITVKTLYVGKNIHFSVYIQKMLDDSCRCRCLQLWPSTVCLLHVLHTEFNLCFTTTLSTERIIQIKASDSEHAPSVDFSVSRRCEEYLSVTSEWTGMQGYKSAVTTSVLVPNECRLMHDRGKEVSSSVAHH